MIVINEPMGNHTPGMERETLQRACFELEDELDKKRLETVGNDNQKEKEDKADVFSMASTVLSVDGIADKKLK